MRRKLRGFKRSAVELDYNLYRVDVPIPGLAGDDLSVIDIRPEGVEQTIVLLHGFAGCAETWEHQINHFSQSYRVVAPDLRGHGQSDAPFTRYTMGELVADLYKITQYLHLPEQFILVGHSFGGSIAVEYASAHPEQIARLVLIATAVQWPVPRIARFFFRLPVAFFRTWWPYRGRWNCEVHTFKRMSLNNLQKWRGQTKMERLSMPTLVITGQRDNYFPRRVYEAVGQTIPGADIVDVGASKHKVQLERHKAVNRAIERFVDGEKKGYSRTVGSWRSGVGAVDMQQRRPWLDFYSPGTPRTVPIPGRPLHDFLYSSAEWLPKRAATVFFGKKLTYARLARSVNQLGHTLHGLGVKPGDRVMIVLPNMPEFLIAYYGALVVGGVVVLSNPDADVEQIVRQLQQTEARVLVTLKGFDRLAREAYRGGVREVLLVEMDKNIAAHVMPRLMRGWRIAGAEAGQDNNEGQSGADEQPAGALMSELMADAPYEPPEVPVSSDDLAAVLFTSGTTDDPKGVCLSHRNLVANAIQTRHWMPDFEYGKEVFLSVVPLLHSYGMTTTMNLPVASAGTIVLLPFFEPKEVLDHVKSYRPTVFPAAPSMYAALAQMPGARSYGLESIRACISGSSPLPVEVQESFEKLTNGRLVEGYGLTEASPVTHANPFGGRDRAGSIGLPLPNTEAKVVDLASGADLPPGQIGQLLVKGPQVMQGYWGQDKAGGALPEDGWLEDGWLDTGDVAVMDVDGYFHIIGRSRDLIRAGEHTVYPRDVEELLYENNKVREVAVVGVPKSAPDQKVKAFVVPREGADLSEEELTALCRRRLEEYAVPWEIEFRDELPKSFTGKVIRRLLVE